MTTSTLKELFIEEHKRDKKFTIISFCLIVAAIFVALGFLFYIGTSLTGIVSNFYNNQAGGEYSWWPKVALTVMVLLGIGYPFYRLRQIANRPRKIDDLLSRVAAGAKATQVTDSVDHKIVIPLGKINIKLCPITYVSIYLDNDPNAYQLPLPKVYVADLKLALSGANMNKLNEIRNALYSDNDTDGVADHVTTKMETDGLGIDPFVATPIKSVDEFKSFLTSDLKETLDEMEQSRTSSRKNVVIMMIIATLVSFGFVGYFVYHSMSGTMSGDNNGTDTVKVIVPFFVLIALMSLAFNFYSRSKVKMTTKGGIQGMNSLVPGADFKERVFKRMIDFVNPTVEYAAIGHVGLPELMESGLFVQKNYDIDGSDQIMGRHNGVPFIMCDLQMHYKANFSNEKEGPDEVFSGQYFVARFNKKFASPVTIKAKTGVKGFFIDNHINSYLTSEGQKVKLEDPEFMDMFNVYANDQVEARYILTPSLMERIKELAKRTKGQYYISFYNNKITVANNSQKDNFEIGNTYSKSFTKNDNELLINFYKDLTDQFALIDELKLNIKIWG